MTASRNEKDTSQKSRGHREGDLNRRVYQHDRCGKNTEVTNEHLRAIYDPYKDVRRTYCVICKDYYPLDEFKWVETGETLSAFRKRLKRMLSPQQYAMQKRLQWGSAIAALAVGAFLGWYVPGIIWKIVAVVVGTPVSLFVFLFISAIVEDAMGIEDLRREL